MDIFLQEKMYKPSSMRQFWRLMLIFICFSHEGQSDPINIFYAAHECVFAFYTYIVNLSNFSFLTTNAAY